jgi:hypothetical protein
VYLHCLLPPTCVGERNKELMPGGCFAQGLGVEENRPHSDALLRQQCEQARYMVGIGVGDENGVDDSDLALFQKLEQSRSMPGVDEDGAAVVPQDRAVAVSDV